MLKSPFKGCSIKCMYVYLFTCASTGLYASKLSVTCQLEHSYSPFDNLQPNGPSQAVMISENAFTYQSAVSELKELFSSLTLKEVSARHSVIGNLFERQPHGTEDLGEANRFEQDSVEEGTQKGCSIKCMYTYLLVHPRGCTPQSCQWLVSWNILTRLSIICSPMVPPRQWWYLKMPSPINLQWANLRNYLVHWHWRKYPQGTVLLEIYSKDSPMVQRIWERLIGLTKTVEEGTQKGFSQLDYPPDHRGRDGGSSEWLTPDPPFIRLWRWQTTHAISTSLRSMNYQPLSPRSRRWWVVRPGLRRNSYEEMQSL